MGRHFVLLISFSLLFGCANTFSRKAAQSAGTCIETQPSFGSKAAGEPCANATECAAVCCPCTGASTKSWAAAACLDNKCATSDVACAATKDDNTYCN